MSCQLLTVVVAPQCDDDEPPAASLDRAISFVLAKAPSSPNKLIDIVFDISNISEDN
jgi:hypothetical protein